MTNRFSSQELQVKEWLKRAEDDELNARSILTHRDGTPNGVCFLSHQMAEKYLKSFLVYKKKWFPKIHLLDKLLELCSKIDNSFLKLKNDAIFLNAFYTPTRYPADYQEFSWKEAEQALKTATRIKDFVLTKIWSSQKRISK